MNWGKPWRHRRGLQVWVGFMRLLAAALLMTMALLSAARGEERIALVVANPAYDGAPSIANAELSAELVATSLRSLGFSVQQVSDGDRADVAHAMYDFAKSLASADSVGIFYYVGHTAQANGRNYMLTRGARTDSKETVDQTALPLDLFLQALEATPTPAPSTATQATAPISLNISSLLLGCRCIPSVGGPAHAPPLRR